MMSQAWTPFFSITSNLQQQCDGASGSEAPFKKKKKIDSCVC